MLCLPRRPTVFSFDFSGRSFNLPAAYWQMTPSLWILSAFFFGAPLYSDCCLQPQSMVHARHDPATYNVSVNGNFIQNWQFNQFTQKSVTDRDHLNPFSFTTIVLAIWGNWKWFWFDSGCAIEMSFWPRFNITRLKCTFPAMASRYWRGCGRSVWRQLWLIKYFRQLARQCWVTFPKIHEFVRTTDLTLLANKLESARFDVLKVNNGFCWWIQVIQLWPSCAKRKCVRFISSFALHRS